VADPKQVKSQYFITVEGFGGSLGLSSLHRRLEHLWKYAHQSNNSTNKKNIDRNASSPVAVFDCFPLGFWIG